MTKNNEINRKDISYLNEFMEKKLEEVRDNLLKVKDVNKIQLFLKEQMEVIQSISVHNFSALEEDKAKFENLKKQYIVLFELYLI